MNGIHILLVISFSNFNVDVYDQHCVRYADAFDRRAQVRYRKLNVMHVAS